MKLFLSKIGAIFGIAAIISFSIYTFVLVSDSLKIDLFYENFTEIHTGSFIAGTSRARYAIDPRYFEDSLDFKNISFTRSKSPYNFSYTEYLLDVVDQKNDMISLFCVSPISFEKRFEFNKEYFRQFNFEKKDFNPINIKYLIKERITPLKITYHNLKILIKEMVYGENSEFDNRKIFTSTSVNKMVKNYPLPTNINKEYLENLTVLIHHFSKTSKVVLVRVPIWKELYEKENVTSPRFNDLMDSIATRNSILYFDLNEIKFNPGLKFYDISHVNPNERKKITETLEHLITKKTR